VIADEPLFIYHVSPKIFLFDKMKLLVLLSIHQKLDMIESSILFPFEGLLEL